MDLYKSICLRVRGPTVTHAHAFVHDTLSTHGHNNRAAGTHLCTLTWIHNGGPLMIYREGEPLYLFSFLCVVDKAAGWQLDVSVHLILRLSLSPLNSLNIYWYDILIEKACYQTYT